MKTLPESFGIIKALLCNPTVKQFNRVRTACFLFCLLVCTRRLTRLWQHQTLKLNERATHHLAAMLRSMRQFDPVAYAEVRFVVFTYACLVL